MFELFYMRMHSFRCCCLNLLQILEYQRNNFKYYFDYTKSDTESRFCLCTSDKLVELGWTFTCTSALLWRKDWLSCFEYISLCSSTVLVISRREAIEIKTKNKEYIFVVFNVLFSYTSTQRIDDIFEGLKMKWYNFKRLPLWSITTQHPH